MQLFKQFVLVAIIFTAIYADKQRDIMVPDLSVRLLDGKKVRLSALLEEGPLLVSFWATWCAPCKKEMIFLEEFHQKYNENNFRVLAISTDSPKSMSKVKSYIRAKKHTFLVGIDPNQEIAKKIRFCEFPRCFVPFLQTPFFSCLETYRLRTNTSKFAEASSFSYFVTLSSRFRRGNIGLTCFSTCG